MSRKTTKLPSISTTRKARVDTTKPPAMAKTPKFNKSEIKEYCKDLGEVVDSAISKYCNHFYETGRYLGFTPNKVKSLILKMNDDFLEEKQKLEGMDETELKNDIKQKIAQLDVKVEELSEDCLETDEQKMYFYFFKKIRKDLGNKIGGGKQRGGMVIGEIIGITLFSLCVIYLWPVRHCQRRRRENRERQQWQAEWEQHQRNERREREEEQQRVRQQMERETAARATLERVMRPLAQKKYRQSHKPTKAANPMLPPRRLPPLSRTLSSRSRSNSSGRSRSSRSRSSSPKKSGGRRKTKKKQKKIKKRQSQCR